jgi:hypothetical protein
MLIDAQPLSSNRLQMICCQSVQYGKLLANTALHGHDRSALPHGTLEQRTHQVTQSGWPLLLNVGQPDVFTAVCMTN